MRTVLSSVSLVLTDSVLQKIHAWKVPVQLATQMGRKLEWESDVLTPLISLDI